MHKSLATTRPETAAAAGTGSTRQTRLLRTMAAPTEQPNGLSIPVTATEHSGLTFGTVDDDPPAAA